MFFFFIFYGLSFSFLLFLLAYFFSFSSNLFGFEKSSPFECGFSPFSGVGVSFSMPFFVISLMFLLFDVEILLVCFYPYFSFGSGVLFFFSYIIIFFIICSTLFEWAKGILIWV